MQIIQYGILKEHKDLLHGFTTRYGGVSGTEHCELNMSRTRETGGTDNVSKNFRILSEYMGISPDRFIGVKQVHGNSVFNVTKDCKAPESGYDAVITNKKGIAIYTIHADCVPILLYDSVKHVIGCVHSGWKGTSLFVCREAIKRMNECYGTDPSDICAAIGPSIGIECYRVGDDVYDVFKQIYGHDMCLYSREYEDGMHIALAEMVKHTLKISGINERRIQHVDLCTCCNTGLFFSHRGDKINIGAMASFIYLRNDLDE